MMEEEPDSDHYFFLSGAFHHRPYTTFGRKKKIAGNLILSGVTKEHDLKHTDRLANHTLWPFCLATEFLLIGVSHKSTRFLDHTNRSFGAALASHPVATSTDPASHRRKTFMNRRHLWVHDSVSRKQLGACVPYLTLCEAKEDLSEYTHTHKRTP